METNTLGVPGATLYYEKRGTGPVLLLIPGGNGDAEPYARIGDALADRFTVVAYERRGFSRSPLDRPLTPADTEARIGTDADDAHLLLASLTDEPAYVFGSSSGAIVALEVMTRYPDQVRLVLPHEPPAVGLLPDGAEWIERLDGVYTTFTASGPGPAMDQFRSVVFGDGPGGLGGAPREHAEPAEPPAAMVAMAARVQENLPFWMEHEVRRYPRYDVDLDALRAVAGRVAVVAGRDSRGQFPYEVNTVLGQRLGRPVTELPGGHVGYMTDAEPFAAALGEVLSRG